MKRFAHSLRWALIKAAAAGTTMVALAFLIPLGLMVQQTARERAFTAAERQAAALGPALAITTEQDAIDRAVASTDAGAQGRMAVHLPVPAGAVGAGGAGAGEAGAGGAGAGEAGAGGAAGEGPGGPTIGEGRATAADVATAGGQGRAFTVAVPGGYALLQPVAVDTGRTAVVEVFVAE
ncbi:two-component sensor histidine kinase, partial [Streptomyces althioticus]